MTTVQHEELDTGVELHSQLAIIPVPLGDDDGGVVTLSRMEYVRMVTSWKEANELNLRHSLRLSELTSKIAQQDVQLVDQSRKESQLNRKIEDYGVKYRDLEKKSDSWKQQFFQEKELQRSQLKREEVLNAELSTFKDQASQWQQMYQMLKEEYKTGKQVEKLQQLENTITNLRKQLRKEESKTEEQAGKLLQLENNVTNLRNQLLKENSKTEKLNDAITNLRRQLADSLTAERDAKESLKKLNELKVETNNSTKRLLKKMINLSQNYMDRMTAKPQFAFLHGMNSQSHETEPPFSQKVQSVPKPSQNLQEGIVCLPTPSLTRKSHPRTLKRPSRYNSPESTYTQSGSGVQLYKDLEPGMCEETTKRNGKKPKRRRQM